MPLLRIRAFTWQRLIVVILKRSLISILLLVLGQSEDVQMCLVATQPINQPHRQQLKEYCDCGTYLCALPEDKDASHRLGL